MAFNYSEIVVLWTYHQYKPTDYAPTTTKLTNWDKKLFASYEDALKEILAEKGIPLTRENKSRVLLLAKISQGGPIKAQVRNACEYYANVSGINLEPSD